MKILANRKIKFLFCSILSCILVFVLISTVLVNLDVRNTVYYIIFCSVCMGAAILLFCYGYFKEQHKIMENAISQITEYISGNKEVTIECNDEGELYRLFHEVNSLVAILNAHAENEKSAKKFLRNTISDISHQLKTPLAALNIYNGIIQGEAKELPTIQEFSQLSEQELDRISRETVNAEKFLALVKKYTDFSELTPAMINEFVEKILVHQAEGKGASRTQEVEIFFNFVGKVEIPHEEIVLTEEEKAALAEQERRRAKKAEYNRRYMEKKRREWREQREREQEQKPHELPPVADKKGEKSA